MVYIHNGLFLSHKKEWHNAICNNIDGPRDCHTKCSKSDKDISYDITYMWKLKKWYKWTYIQNRNRLTDRENKLMVTKGERWREGQIRSLGLTDTQYYVENR